MDLLLRHMREKREIFRSEEKEVEENRERELFKICVCVFFFWVSFLFSLRKQRHHANAIPDFMEAFKSRL